MKSKEMQLKIPNILIFVYVVVLLASEYVTYFVVPHTKEVKFRLPTELWFFVFLMVSSVDWKLPKNPKSGNNWLEVGIPLFFTTVQAGWLIYELSQI